jgi:hypothetical protein
LHVGLLVMTFFRVPEAEAKFRMSKTLAGNGVKPEAN